jgi:hypothetical protein
MCLAPAEQQGDQRGWERWGSESSRRWGQRYWWTAWNRCFIPPGHIQGFLRCSEWGMRVLRIDVVWVGLWFVRITLSGVLDKKKWTGWVQNDRSYFSDQSERWQQQRNKQWPMCLEDRVKSICYKLGCGVWKNERSLNKQKVPKTWGLSNCKDRVTTTWVGEDYMGNKLRRENSKYSNIFK